MQLRLRIRVQDRRPEGDDELEGRHLAELVRGALERGSAAPVAVVVRDARTELVGLHGVVEARVPLPSFVAGLCASDVAEHGRPRVVGVAGRFLVGMQGAPGTPPAPGSPVGLAFLEWPDNRWWHWRVLLDGDGKPVPDSETVRRAIDGDPLPGGLGRWWSLSRRSGAVVRYGTVDAAPTGASPLVH